MIRVARVVAQAKINLLLRVLSREESGYHSLETVFLRLALGDSVTVRVGTGVHGRTLECYGGAMPRAGLGPIEQNLAYRAAVAYANATGWPPTFAIEVEKRIPVGGGLGGGSADAGAVLRALDALAPVPLGLRLPELAVGLGADVPFLTLEHPMALAWGRGERLLPLPVLAKRPVVLLAPGFSVVTAEAFAWLAATRGPYLARAAVLEPSDLATWEAIAARAMNEFEAVVAARHPEISRYVDALRAEGAVPALMTGSGSVVYGMFDDALTAAAVAAKLTSAFAGGDVRGVVTDTAERVERVAIGVVPKVT